MNSVYKFLGCLGSYEDALKTLTTSEHILSVAEEEPDPINVAFQAMIMYRMGSANKAKSGLEQLLELCKNDQFAYDIQVLGLLAITKQLIAVEEL